MSKTVKEVAQIKIKDLPGNPNLRGVKFHDPKTGTTGYWFSQWIKGVWWKKDFESTNIIPLFLDDLKEALEFKVMEEK